MAVLQCFVILVFTNCGQCDENLLVQHSGFSQWELVFQFIGTDRWKDFLVKE